MLTDIESLSNRVLIIDDVVDNLNMLTDLLEAEGYDVHIATDGLSGLEFIQKMPPDLILLDIQMPGMDGYEVCTRIKTNPPTKDIPVIFLSAHTETTDVLKGFEVGGVDYISKPFQYREVAARVQSQLTLAHQRQQLIQQRQEIESLREKDLQHFNQLSKIKDQIIRTTAHDLKNPLTSVLLYCQLLEEAELESEVVDEALAGIRQGMRKMQRLVTDVLELAQMQTGANLKRFPTSIQKLIQEVLQSYELIAKEQNIIIGSDFPTQDIHLMIDRNRIERVLDNLISNAIKYTPEGGQVRVAIELEATQALIHVQDTGLGIPQKDFENLFEPFYRIKKPDHAQIAGTGLGLSIVKAIVNQHDGTIKVCSQLNKGSTFTISIPR